MNIFTQSYWRVVHKHNVEKRRVFCGSKALKWVKNEDRTEKIC